MLSIRFVKKGRDMYDSWTCLSVSKGPGVIPDGIKFAMKMAACRLHKEKRDSMLFQTDEASGLISTAWNTHSLGTRTGVLFNVELESDGGVWQVNFLLHTRDLERGAERLGDPDIYKGYQWQHSPIEFPIEELHQFKDLSSRSLN